MKLTAIITTLYAISALFFGPVEAQEQAPDTSTTLEVRAHRGTDRELSDSLAVVFESAAEKSPTDDETIPREGFTKLEDFLAAAANQSPALKSAFYEWKAALEKSGYAGALPDPNFTFGYFIESIETRVGPQRSRAALRQTLPWFGKRGAKKDVSLEAAGAAYERFQSEKLAIFYRVKSAYYEYYFLGRDIAITRDNLELLKFWESVVRAKYRVALSRHPDVIKAQVELGSLEDRLRSLEARLEPAEARLRAAVGLSRSDSLMAPATIIVDETDLNKEEVTARVMANNPDLRSLDFLVRKNAANKRHAGKSSWPDLTVGVEYIGVGDAIDPTMIDSGKDAWMASVGLNIPIWFGKNKARKKAADADYRRAQYAYAAATDELAAVVDELVFRHTDALRKTQLYRDGLVPKAEQALNASYTAFQAGETDFLNLLDAQRQWLDFQLSYQRALTDLAIARAEIEMLTGEELQ